MPSVINVGGCSSEEANEEVTSRVSDEKEMKICDRKGSTVQLELEDIKKHFNVPINIAAKEMNVGMTLLKKRCRELNITRWPHRKIKSLKCLIENVKELGLQSEVDDLEEHMAIVEQQPNTVLNEKAKKLRQACFKAKYKKKSLSHNNSKRSKSSNDIF